MKHLSLRQSICSSVALSTLVLAGGASFAQNDADAPVVIEEKKTEKEARQEKVVITGSLLARDEFTSASPVQVITAEVATLEGLVDTADLLQGSSLAAGATQLNNTFQNYVTNGGVGTQTLDLRGCGDTRTLVLIDGKRPGPAGTRGSVSAFDLNNIPQSIVSRVEILKDGASTIYGSDAVCGVVNVITRDSVDGLELNFTGSVPEESGGENFRLSGAYGFDWGDNASFTISGEYRKSAELNIGDRSYLECPVDRVTDPLTGNRIDRLNYSATATDPMRSCSNLYHNTVLDYTEVLAGISNQIYRLIPTPDGVEAPTPWGVFIPGYRPRPLAGTGYNAEGQPYYEDILDAPFLRSIDFAPEQENISLFGTADVEFGGLVWDTEILYNRRTTKVDGWRQFAPFVGDGNNIFGSPSVGYASDPTYSSGAGTIVRPILTFQDYSEFKIDYFNASTSLSGGYGDIDFLSDWSWKVDGTFSRSKGTYGLTQILLSKSGDWNYQGEDWDGDGTPNVITPPTIDYLDPDVLNGTRQAELRDAVTAWDEGETIYEQTIFTATTAGELFDVYAGPVGLALGLEYREFSIDDTPGKYTLEGDVWGRSTAGPTRGDNKVLEYFAETSIPLLKGMPFAEDVELSASWRGFDYDLGGSDSIYKIGLNWQINPVFRVRASQGTSYRAPALFELFLEDQTGFVDQGFDPCVEWGQSNNPNIRANCAAAGVPDNYGGSTGTALAISSGGGTDLKPETGDTFTAGIVFTPTFADLNIALDYYEIEIDDQIASLSAGQVVGGCYSAETYPNYFCGLFERTPGGQTGAYGLDNIRTPTLNVDSQQQRGIDLEVRYEKEFNFGILTVDLGMNWALERYVNVFGANVVSGIDNNDFNGTIGYPSVVGDVLITFDRGDWTYSWFTDYVGHQDDNRYFNADLNEPQGYFNSVGYYDSATEAQFTHGASVRWEGDTWTFAGGVRNIFDEHPPAVSPDVATTSAGNVPLSATQYDILGRTFFFSVSKTF